MNKTLIKSSLSIFIILALGCSNKKSPEELQTELAALNLKRGNIALCGSGQFGNVNFGLSCAEQVRGDFNTATALLHSFEYAEAEKVFAKVIDNDPQCLMAYWGVAMSNFHPLWAPPGPDELKKGWEVIKLARSIDNSVTREKLYIEAIATIFDNWETQDHKTRLEKFVKAAEVVYQQNPDDTEAALFYALALRASADPADKTFEKQKKAGAILNAIFPDKPDHPGVAHYLIHNYDYPELAELALPAARKYAAIAATSAHAQHMPSHIFTRLGLWDESIQSNTNSMEAAKCYAENLGEKGHWDQELHGLDYAVYAYLQEGKDDKAKELTDYLGTIDQVFPIAFVNAYTFAAVPVRYVVERKDWKQAASLSLHPADFPWEKFPWQKAIYNFGRALGAVHTGDLAEADKQLVELKNSRKALEASKKEYEANQVNVQIGSVEAWISYAKGNKTEALQSMIAAAEREDATEKHSVTPGEVAPARELLGDLYVALRDYNHALEAYEANLRNRPGRFNSVYGAAVSAKGKGDMVLAKTYYEQLLEITRNSNGQRREVKEAEAFLGGS